MEGLKYSKELMWPPYALVKDGFPLRCDIRRNVMMYVFNVCFVSGI